jgi:hypothetical protein
MSPLSEDATPNASVSSFHPHVLPHVSMGVAPLLDALVAEYDCAGRVVTEHVRRRRAKQHALTIGLAVKTRLCPDECGLP